MALMVRPIGRPFLLPVTTVTPVTAPLIASMNVEEAITGRQCSAAAATAR
jgi:hypothetical protein